MKKTLLSMSGILLVLCFTGCSNSTNNANEISVSSSESSLISSKSDKSLSASSLSSNETGFIYNDVTIRNDESTGSPKSYSELVDFLEPYSDNMNFVRFSIEKQYSPDKAAELIGEELAKVSTLFDAHIDYDYLNNAEADMDILLVQAGNAESQYANCPLYGIGDVYAAFLSGFDPSSWNVACPELLFAIFSDTSCYHINAEEIVFSDETGSVIGKSIPEENQLVYTTTSNNPVKYVQDIRMEDLSNFFVSDWLSRGFSFSNLEEM